jgi:hypothetical protein
MPCSFLERHASPGRFETPKADAAKDHFSAGYDGNDSPDGFKRKPARGRFFDGPTS